MPNRFSSLHNYELSESKDDNSENTSTNLNATVVQILGLNPNH